MKGQHAPWADPPHFIYNKELCAAQLPFLFLSFFDDRLCFRFRIRLATAEAAGLCQLLRRHVPGRRLVRALILLHRRIIRILFLIVFHRTARIYLLILGNGLEGESHLPCKDEHRYRVECKRIHFAEDAGRDERKPAHDREHRDTGLHHDSLSKVRIHVREPDISARKEVVDELLIPKHPVPLVMCKDLLHDVRHIFLEAHGAVIEYDEERRDESDKDDTAGGSFHDMSPLLSCSFYYKGQRGNQQGEREPAGKCQVFLGNSFDCR